MIDSLWFLKVYSIFYKMNKYYQLFEFVEKINSFYLLLKWIKEQNRKKSPKTCIQKALRYRKYNITIGL